MKRTVYEDFTLRSNEELRLRSVYFALYSIHMLRKNRIRGPFSLVCSDLEL